MEHGEDSEFEEWELICGFLLSKYIGDELKCWEFAAFVCQALSDGKSYSDLGIEIVIFEELQKSHKAMTKLLLQGERNTVGAILLGLGLSQASYTEEDHGTVQEGKKVDRTWDQDNRKVVCSITDKEPANEKIL